MPIKYLMLIIALLFFIACSNNQNYINSMFKDKSGWRAINDERSIIETPKEIQ